MSWQARIQWVTFEAKTWRWIDCEDASDAAKWFVSGHTVRLVDRGAL